MGIFSSPEHGACGIFAQDGWCGSQQVQDITFVRARSLLLGTAPVQNTAGEVLLSFATLGTYTLQPQPLPAGFTRMVAGQVVQIDQMFFDFGFVDLQTGDRCSFEGKQIEVTNVLPYYGSHQEIECKQIGR